MRDRAAVDEVIGQASRVSGRMVLHLAPRFDGDHTPLSFAKRHDGVPCEAATCEYAFVLAVPIRSRESAERQAREQLRERATRYFVELQLDDACVMACEDLAQVDEAKLREADPTAHATLRLLRDAGADVVLVRGILSRRIAVVFQQSIGHAVHVVDEAAATIGRDGTWVRDAPKPARAHDRWRALVRRPRVGRMAWELAIALVCFLLAPPIADAAGTTLTVPVWGELLLGAIAAGMAAVTTWRALAPARAEIARMPEQLDRFERLVRTRNHQLHREVALMDRFDAAARDAAPDGADEEQRSRDGEDRAEGD